MGNKICLNESYISLVCQNAVLCGNGLNSNVSAPCANDDYATRLQILGRTGE